MPLLYLLKTFTRAGSIRWPSDSLFLLSFPCPELAICVSWSFCCGISALKHSFHIWDQSKTFSLQIDNTIVQKLFAGSFWHCYAGAGNALFWRGMEWVPSFPRSVCWACATCGGGEWWTSSCFPMLIIVRQFVQSRNWVWSFSLITCGGGGWWNSSWFPMLMIARQFVQPRNWVWSFSLIDLFPSQKQNL